MPKSRFNPMFSRRGMLAALGASAGLGSFLPLLTREAEAGGGMPKRLILFFHPHGTIRENWLPTGGTEDFTLPSILQPLQRHRSDIAVIDGLQIYPQGPVGGPHSVGPCYLWTGSRMEDGDAFDHGCCTPHGWNTHASVDQVVAQQLGTQTAFRSLEFGIGTGGRHPGQRMSYEAAGGVVLDPERSPLAMFNRLFGDWSGDPTQAARLKADRLAVLDAVGPELDALMSRVGREDVPKIEAHMGALADIEHRLSLQHDCQSPDAPPDLNAELQDNVPEISRLQIDLLVEAMACGLTNVGSLMYRRGENDNQPYPWLGIDAAHHETSHAGNSNVEARQNLTDIYTWYAGEFAYLLDRLAGVVEADGTRLLDNTLVVWGSEIATGNTHSWANMPFVLAGSAGGAVQTGRFVTHEGVNHCRLLTTICQAMGLGEIDTFGNLDDGTGALGDILV